MSVDVVEAVAASSAVVVEESLVRAGRVKRPVAVAVEEDLATLKAVALKAPAIMRMDIAADVTLVRLLGFLPIIMVRIQRSE